VACLMEWTEGGTYRRGLLWRIWADTDEEIIGRSFGWYIGIYIERFSCGIGRGVG
jgi:hypothetical protein